MQLVSLAAFLAFLCISKPWPTELPLHGDVVALRFLLFLSHVYGVALLLTCPLVTLETLIRLRRPWAKETEEGGGQQSHGVSFLCCLSVWVLTALEVQRRGTLEEACASACVHTTKSLLTCLPGLFSPVSSNSGSCMALTFVLLVLLLLLLFLTAEVRARCRTSAKLAETHKANRGGVSGLTPAGAGPPETLVPADVRGVDPEKTVSSCVVPEKSEHVSAPQLGDFSCPERFPAGQKQEGTKRAKPLTFMAGAQEESNPCVWCHWAFPCLGLNVITGLIGALCVFVLPLILSVNIVLVRTLDYLMELSVQALLASPAADKRSTWTSCKATGSRPTCQRRFQESSFSRATNNLEIC